MMLSYSKNIFQKLTGKTSLEEVPVDQLKKLAEDYPYFGAAQFFLAKKLFTENNESYKTAAEKVALHFANALWLNINLENVVEEDKIETQHFKKFEPNISLKKESFDEFDDDEEIDATDEPLIITETDNIINEKLSNLLKEQAAEFEKPVETTEPLADEITPYHRIDYFESQGIKLDAEKETNDKLGKRLRRFTDWLKEMKSVNPNLTNMVADEAGETKVQTMAENSNEPKEILTEAMAEVLVKQGKPKQAIQVYEKLSFYNPSKSAYFAAKIEDLKGK